MLAACVQSKTRNIGTEVKTTSADAFKEVWLKLKRWRDNDNSKSLRSERNGQQGVAQLIMLDGIEIRAHTPLLNPNLGDIVSAIRTVGHESANRNE